MQLSKKSHNHPKPHQYGCNEERNPDVEPPHVSTSSCFETSFPQLPPRPPPPPPQLPAQSHCFETEVGDALSLCDISPYAVVPISFLEDQSLRNDVKRNEPIYGFGDMFSSAEVVCSTAKTEGTTQANDVTDSDQFVQSSAVQKIRRTDIQGQGRIELCDSKCFREACHEATDIHETVEGNTVMNSVITTTTLSRLHGTSSTAIKNNQSVSEISLAASSKETTSLPNPLGMLRSNRVKDGTSDIPKLAPRLQSRRKSVTKGSSLRARPSVERPAIPPRPLDSKGSIQGQ